MIFINDIPSLCNPTSFEVFFDDRIEKIELINGNTVQNYGHIQSGDSFALTCTFSYANYLRICALWESDTRVSFTDEAGEVWLNMRLVLRKEKYVSKFPAFVDLTFELWRV